MHRLVGDALRHVSLHRPEEVAGGEGAAQHLLAGVGGVRQALLGDAGLREDLAQDVGIALLQAIRAVLLIGLALVLTRLMGTVGAAVAVLASQLITMVLILPGLRAVLAQDRPRPAVAAAEGELS